MTPKPAPELALQVGGRSLVFENPGAFEFALAGRVEVPSRKITSLSHMDSTALKDEARRIRGLEKQLLDLLTQSIEKPGSLHDALGTIPLTAYSQDHGWREVMTALLEVDLHHEEYVRLAVVKYLQYLTARQEILKAVYRIRKETSKQFASSEPEREGEPHALRETMILELPMAAGHARRTPNQVTRLPKGEPVLLTRAAGTEVVILLSTHEYLLRFGLPGEWRQSGSNAAPQALHAGKNIIGRDTACDVVVVADAGDVSRLHLIVECLDASNLKLTDLSSHGTYLKEVAAA
jgi:hypothetical protein